jgi:hypothetical protein
MRDPHNRGRFETPLPMGPDRLNAINVLERSKARLAAFQALHAQPCLTDARRVEIGNLVRAQEAIVKMRRIACYKFN